MVLNGVERLWRDGYMAHGLLKVVSFLVGSVQTKTQGTFCEACASKRISNASLVTCMFGWWSLFGLCHTCHALASNGNAGDQPLVNLEICTHQAIYYSQRGDHANARIAARDAQAFAFAVKRQGKPSEQSRAEQIIPILNQVLAEPCMT